MVSDELAITQQVDVVIVVFEILEIVLRTVFRRVLDFLESNIYIFEAYAEFRDLEGKSLICFWAEEDYSVFALIDNSV